MFKNVFHINPDINLLHANIEKDYIEFSENGTRNDEKTDAFKESLSIRSQRLFENVENAENEISFRCSKIHSCKLWKEHDQSEILSVREEVEQDVINNSIEVSIKNRVTAASLPLMQNPVIKLAPNQNKGLHIFNQQIQKLDQNLQDKNDFNESETKLRKLRFVKFVKNVTPEQQQMLKPSDVQKFIPGRAV